MIFSVIHSSSALSSATMSISHGSSTLQLLNAHMIADTLARRHTVRAEISVAFEALVI